MNLRLPVTKRRLAAAIVALSLTMIPAAGCRRIYALFHPNACVLSDRPIDTRMAVGVDVEGGKRGEACCIRCAITTAKQSGKRVRILWVTDYSTRKQIPPGQAYYVTGSDVAPCAGHTMKASAGRREVTICSFDRCIPSSISFASIADARSFQQSHGGRLETFADVVKGSTVVAR